MRGRRPGFAFALWPSGHAVRAISEMLLVFHQFWPNCSEQSVACHYPGLLGSWREKHIPVQDGPSGRRAEIAVRTGVSHLSLRGIGAAHKDCSRRSALL